MRSSNLINNAILPLTGVTMAGYITARVKTYKDNLIKLGFIEPFPKVLSVFVTNRCNFSCNYCSRNLDNEVVNKYIEESEFRIDDLNLLLNRYPTIATVSFVGIGEPFLAKDLIPMAKLCKEYKKNTHVITNASQLHRNWGNIARNFDSLSISLHGLSSEELMNIAHVNKGVFDQLIKNIKYLMEKEILLNLNIKISASVVVLKDNLDRVQKAAEFCVNNSIPVLELHNYLPVDIKDSKRCIFEDDEIYIRYIKDLKKIYTGKLNITLPIFIKRNPGDLSLSCMTFFRTLRVDSLGNVSGCSRIFIPRAQNGNFKIEKDVWKNYYFESMRKAFICKKGVPDLCRFCPDAQ